MSISVTVSGEDSTSVISAQSEIELVSVSGSNFIDVTSFGTESASITISTGDPITIRSNYTNYVTGEVVRPPEIVDFLTENQINSKISTATGEYDSVATNKFYASSNPSGFITGVDLSSYVQNSETGNFITDSETGAFYATPNPSGFITGVDLSD